jgi:hypothetical protein
MSTNQDAQNNAASATLSPTQLESFVTDTLSSGTQSSTAEQQATEAGQSAPPPASSPGFSARSVPQAATSQIPTLIAAYKLRIRSISRCAREYIALAQKTSQEWRDRYLLQLEEISTELKSLSSSSQLGESETKVKSLIAPIMDAIKKGDFHYHIEKPHSAILSQSLLIFGFSAFDAFLGALIAQLCQEEHRLLHKFEEKTVQVHDLLAVQTIEEVLTRLIERDISTLLRDSYDDVFTALEKRHDIHTLKDFPNWQGFIEAAQRRNLITHCDGIVNAQYIEACKRSGVALGSEVVSGYQLEVSSQYLQETLDILYEVGVKLAYVLWRKTNPSQAKESEKHLSLEVYDLLVREEWHLAKIIGKFSLELPKPKHDLYVRIGRINYAQALKWSGDNIGAMTVLDADWSSSTRDLRLGVEVLRENFDDAVSLMKAIGKNGELVNDPAYHEWPLFRKFRTTEKFKLAYAEVYGAPFNRESEKGLPMNVISEPQLTGQESPPKMPETGDKTMSPEPLPEIKPDSAQDADSGKAGTD